MPRYETRRTVGHSAQAMFDLVADIERYPEFVPLCEALKVRARRQGDDHREILTAAMTIGYKLFRETFTSRVVLDRASLMIFVTYLDGPLQNLENRWQFVDETSKGCTVDFYLAYEFRSRTLGLVMGAVFDKVFSRFAEAFEQRADAIYGRRFIS